MTQVSLKRKAPNGEYQEYELEETVTTLGRSKSCDIVINDASLSRLHLRLENREGNYIVVDNNSSNGTFLNRRKITQAPLKNGDILRTGRIDFIFTQIEESGTKTRPMSPLREPAQIGATLSVEHGALSSLDGLGTDSVPLGSGDADPNIEPPPPPPLPDEDSTNNTANMPQDPFLPPEPMVPPSTEDYGESSPATGNMATPVQRLLAFLIDIGLAIAAMIPGVALSMVSTTLGYLLMFLGVILQIAHPIVGWLKYGKTLGKHFMGLQIVSDQDPGPGLSPRTVVLRLVGYMACFATLYLLFLYILIDPEKLGIQDKIAGTRVIQDKK